MQRIVFLSFIFTLFLFASNPFTTLPLKDSAFLSMVQKEHQVYEIKKEATLLRIKKAKEKKLRLAKIHSIKSQLETLANEKKFILNLLVKAKKEEARKKKIALAKASHLHAKIDISKQNMRVYKGDTLLHKWKISSGKKGHATPRGSYKVLWTSKRYRSRKYNNASMPYSVFFKNGYAIHGTKSVKRLGRRASHGCIRLRTSNAKKFYALVRKAGKKNTSIRINN